MLFTILIYIVFVSSGETYAGKSSIINLILGQKILPTGITFTSRVCRIKYSASYIVHTYDSKDEKLDEMSFGNLKEMTEKLIFLAETCTPEISCIDIYMPVPFLKVHTFTGKKSELFLLIEIVMKIYE